MASLSVVLLERFVQSNTLPLINQPRPICFGKISLEILKSFLSRLPPRDLSFFKKKKKKEASRLIATAFSFTNDKLSNGGGSLILLLTDFAHPWAAGLHRF